jgi:hypothetical protein
MDLVIRCPQDKQVLGEINSRGEFLGICPRCKCAYGAHFGQLTAKHSKQRTIQRQTRKQRGVYLRDYEFRLSQPSGKLYTLRFSISGKDDRLGVRRGDQVVVIYQANAKGDLQQVLRVQNKTTGGDDFVSSPKTGATASALLGIAVGVLAFMFLLSALPPAIGLLSLGVSIALGVGVAVFSLRLRQIKLSPEKQAEIAQSQGLLEEKTKISQRIGELASEMQTAQEQFNRLKALHERMNRTDPKAYASRMKTLKAAGNLLRQSIQGTKRLMDEYAKALEIIDIEYESGQVGQDFASNPDSLISRKLDELKAIESRNSDIRLQLQANEEVKKLAQS